MSDLIPHDREPASAEPPHSESTRDQSHQTHAGHTRGPRPPILTTEECLQNLALLASMTVLGQIRPALANAARANYEAILKHHRQGNSRSAQPTLADADVLDLASRDPAILAMFEHFLTDEQIARILSRRDQSGA